MVDVVACSICFIYGRRHYVEHMFIQRCLFRQERIYLMTGFDDAVFLSRRRKMDLRGSEVLG
jgi:hypothetical protein